MKTKTLREKFHLVIYYGIKIAVFNRDNNIKIEITSTVK